MERKPLGSATINLSRAGFPGSQGLIEIPTPSEVIQASRYGIFVDVSHPFDRDLTNNKGEQTIDGFATSEKRTGAFVIPVRNPLNSVANIDFAVNPAKWDAALIPSSLTLAAGAQKDIMFSVTVPNGIPPSPAGTIITETFEIIATTQGRLIGGVAILVLVDA